MQSRPAANRIIGEIHLFKTDGSFLQTFWELLGRGYEFYDVFVFIFLWTLKGGWIHFILIIYFIQVVDPRWFQYRILMHATNENMDFFEISLYVSQDLTIEII